MSKTDKIAFLQAQAENLKDRLLSDESQLNFKIEKLKAAKGASKENMLYTNALEYLLQIATNKL